MLFWLFLIVLTVGIIAMVIGFIDWSGNKNKNKLKDFFCWHYKIFQCIGVFMTFIGGIISIVLVLVLVSKYVNIDSEVERSKETYKAITYKVESGACRDEFGLLNKEVIDEIQSWNETVAYNKKMQNNFWIGIFYPNVYDQFETIDYEKFVRK